jgi:hypothetical protein
MDTMYWINDTGLSLLTANVEANQSAYLTGDFDDFFEDNKAKLQDVGLKIDHSMLDNLSGQSKDEVDDSCILFEAISGMTPSLAARGNTWAFLSHTALHAYGKKRWLDGKTDPIREIKKHFASFSPAVMRDDHVASRLWWNSYLASRIAGSDDISEIKKTLKLFFRTTDTRSASIERPTTFGDVDLARLILEHVKNTPSLADQLSYREFMVKINFEGNGLKFSEMTYETFAEKFG